MNDHPSGSGRPHAEANAAATVLLRARSPRRLSLLLLAALATVVLFAQFGSSAGAAAQATASFTVDAHDFASGSVLPHFNYIVNVDNAKLPGNSLALNSESFSPIVKEGNETTGAVSLPSSGCGATGNAGPNGVGCRYVVSVRSPDHKMWGKHITLPADAGTVRIDLTEASADHPLPLGKLRVFVFNDNFYTNGAPDTEEAGLAGFTATLTEQTNSDVTVDYHNHPLCGSTCVTNNQGFVEIPNLGPATYFIYVNPPNGPCNSDPSSQWYQTTTIDGGFNLIAPVEEGSDGTGAPGEQLWEPPNARTAYWYGFVCAPKPFPTTGTGEITGQASNWAEWAPYTTGTYNEPVENPFVAVSDANTGQTLYVGRGDAAGNFDIQNVPAGSYILSVWDEQLSYIIRFKNLTVDAGETVDVNDVGDDGVAGIGVSRWFGWLDGTVYKDVNNNGRYDSGTDTPLANTGMDNRWRDGSIKDVATTDPSGYYQYPNAEGGFLGRWFINEQGFTQLSAYPGPSMHDEHTGAVTPSCAVDPPAVPANPCVPTDQGGGLLSNQLLTEGHRATVDWGKRDYPAGTPGQIVGVTYFATTRNEFQAYKQNHEDYEPGIPDVTVLLETPGPDTQPGTADDVVVNKYVTDHWQQPNASQDPQDPPGNSFKQNCNPIRDFGGADITSLFSSQIGPNCLEVPLTGEQTKDGTFDGGYAFADYCPNGYDLNADDGTCNGGTDPVALVAGTYVTHAVMPTDPDDSRPCNPASGPGLKKVSGPFGDQPNAQTGCLWRPVREEDVNVDLGNQFESELPQPFCTGDAHVMDQSTLVTRSNYYTGNQGTSPSAPLCDKRLVVLQNLQNANADFYMMTNFNTDPNGANASDNRAGDVAEPGRIVGQVFNDIYFERNKQSPWYGEPRPIGGLPIGIYARVDVKQSDGFHISGKEIGRDGAQAQTVTYDGNKWRLITSTTTSKDGSFEVLLPSTETFNCPIPQGPCPGMYLVAIDDAGFKDPGPGGDHANKNFNPNLLYYTTPAEVWPGLTTQMDVPIDPISNPSCEDPAVEPTPNLLQVSRPYVNAADSGSARRITIQGDFIGTPGPGGNTGGHVNLTDLRTGAVETLNNNNGGIVSWTPGSGSTADTIVIRVPALNTTTFRPGPKQLTIVTATANGGVSSVNGITIHVLGSNGTGTNTVTYSPPIVNVATPTLNGHQLQNAIDGAAAGSLLVLSPGTYNENVLLWKSLKIQGLGPGGIIGSHELQGRDPEDPRFNVTGSVIDGRFFQQNATAFDATVAAHAPYAVDPTLPTILSGADITAVAKTTSAYNLYTQSGVFSHSAFSAAGIDGLGLTTGQGEGAGGIQLQANINNMQLTNNELENNGGIFAGGIGLGQPYAHQSHNYNVRIANNRLIGNGGLTRSGGVGIFYGANNYEVANSIVCGNYGVEYGAGISHWGLSPNGSIHDNKIFYNESFDAGAGISIQTEPPVSGGLGTGSGPVNVDRNLIQSNYSGDDGGGIFVLDALTEPINIRNNMIVDNGASDLGGAIMLADASNVRIINNTVANNVTTASSENTDGQPHAAGLASEGNDPLFQAMLPPGSPDFSNPAALFNNIFWNNNAFTLSQPGPGATLVNHGFIDFEIHGTTNNADTFTPRYSDLTNGQILVNGTLHPLPGGQANLIGSNPGFVTPFILELTVTGSRLDPQLAAVTITGADPPVGLTGDYHITNASPVVDRGAGFSNLATPAPLVQTPSNTTSILAPCSGTSGQAYPADYDRELRPQLRTNAQVRTTWDIGADERPGTNLPVPGSYNQGPDVNFNWNNTGHLQCSGSTETR
jgi:hypothetical protein